MSTQRVEVRKLACPNCDSPVSQFTPDAQTIVCSTCGSYVAVGAGEPSVMSNPTRIPPPSAPIEIGQMLTLDGTSYFVMGRVHYTGWDASDLSDKWSWDEWLLGSNDGRLLWLSYDEKGFSLFRKMRFRAPFSALTDRTLPVGEGKSAPVHERYPARIVGAEGELTWRAKAGDSLYMVEAAAHNKRYSVQKTDEEMEVYEGMAVEEIDIAKATNDERWMQRIVNKQGGVVTRALIGVICIAFAAAAFVYAFASSSGGQTVLNESVQLSSAAPVTVLQVPFDQTGRPAEVSVRAANGLPVNATFSVDVSVTSPNEIKNFLFEQEFWHETGVDEDGAWTDTRYNQSGMFVPTVTGDHQLELTFNNAVGVDAAALQVRVERNNVFPFWLYLYGGVVGIIGLVLLFVSIASGNAPKSWGYTAKVVKA
ncbi:MAG: hypothetical protein OHK0046_02040 [Anaerolineae bacterium]